MRRSPPCGLRGCRADGRHPRPSRGARGERVSQVADAHIGEPGVLADSLPRALQVGRMRVGRPADDDPRVSVLAGDGRRRGAGFRSERHGAPTDPAIGKLKAVILYMFPSQVPDFRHSAAGEQQQAEGSHGRWHFRLGFAQPRRAASSLPATGSARACVPRSASRGGTGWSRPSASTRPRPRRRSSTVPPSLRLA